MFGVVGKYRVNTKFLTSFLKLGKVLREISFDYGGWDEHQYIIATTTTKKTRYYPQKNAIITNKD